VLPALGEAIDSGNDRDKTKSDIYSLSKAKTNYTQARQFTTSL
jgi:hypothetical protein